MRQRSEIAQLADMREERQEFAQLSGVQDAIKPGAGMKALGLKPVHADHRVPPQAQVIERDRLARRDANGPMPVCHHMRRCQHVIRPQPVAQVTRAAEQPRAGPGHQVRGRTIDAEGVSHDPGQLAGGAGGIAGVHRHRADPEHGQRPVALGQHLVARQQILHRHRPARRGDQRAPDEGGMRRLEWRGGGRVLLGFLDGTEPIKPERVIATGVVGRVVASDGLRVGNALWRQAGDGHAVAPQYARLSQPRRPPPTTTDGQYLFF
jgi:hypothetical protein